MKQYVELIVVDVVLKKTVVAVRQQAGIRLVVLAEKYFSGIVPVNRTFSCVAVAYTDEQYPEFDFYGSEGIDATSIGGYKSVFASNIYGKRIDKHFHCGHNLSHDPKLLMVLRAIGGIAVDELSETEKEIAAKALEYGYLR